MAKLERYEDTEQLRQALEGVERPYEAPPAGPLGVPTGDPSIDNLILKDVRPKVRDVLGAAAAQDILNKEVEERSREFLGRVPWTNRMFSWMTRRRRGPVTAAVIEARARREVMSPVFISPKRLEQALNANPTLKDLIEKHVGKEVLSEMGDYPGLRYAIAWLLQRPTPPGPEQFLRDALGIGGDYNKALKEFTDAEERFTDFSGNAGNLKKFAGDIVGLAKKVADYRNEKTALENDRNNAETDLNNAMAGLGTATTDSQRAVFQARIQQATQKRDEARRELKELEKNKSELKSSVREFYAIIDHFCPAAGTQLVPALRVIAGAAATPESQARVDIETLNSNAQDADDGIFQGAVHAIESGAFKRNLQVMLGVITVKQQEFEEEKDKTKKDLEGAKEVKGKKLSPEALLFTLYNHYYKTPQANGGALPPGATAPDKDTLRNMAALAMRLSVVDSKDMSVFDVNRYRAEELHRQSKWYRRMFNRFSWGKSADTVGARFKHILRPGAPAKRIMERLRHIEVKKEEKLVLPFARLRLKPWANRAELRREIEEGRLAEEDVPRLYVSLERILKDNKGFSLRSHEVTYFADLIRNLKIIRQEMLHKKLMDQLAREPGSKAQKMVKLMEEQLAEETKIEQQLADEVGKQEFLEILKASKISLKHQALMHEVYDKMRKGELSASEAQEFLESHGVDKGVVRLWTGSKFANLGEKIWGEEAEGEEKKEGEGAEEKPSRLKKAAKIITAPIWVPGKYLVWYPLKGVGKVVKGTLEWTIVKPLGLVWTGFRRLIGDAIWHDVKLIARETIPTPSDVKADIAKIAGGAAKGGH